MEMLFILGYLQLRPMLPLTFSSACRSGPRLTRVGIKDRLDKMIISLFLIMLFELLLCAG